MKTHKQTDERILNQIYLIRGQKVMVDSDLAVLYGVETKRLKEAVRRNLKRFPEDFMFQMTQIEMENWRSQIVSSNAVRHRTFCFTEQGVTMPACVLNSDLAIEMNIRIIRLFTQMRESISIQREVLARIDLLERKLGDHEEHLQRIFEALHLLLNRDRIAIRTGKIGFIQERDSE